MWEALNQAREVGRKDKTSHKDRQAGTQAAPLRLNGGWGGGVFQAEIGEKGVWPEKADCLGNCK